MLKGHLPRVIYLRVYSDIRRSNLAETSFSSSIERELYSAVQFLIEEQQLDKKVQWSQRGLVFKAHRRVYRSTLGSKVMMMTKKKKHNLAETSFSSSIEKPGSSSPSPCV